jgi:hypothetical protein
MKLLALACGSRLLILIFGFRVKPGMTTGAHP